LQIPYIQPPLGGWRHLTLHLAFWQLLTSPVYLESFLSKASSKQSSHGSVSSSSTTCFVVSHTRTISLLLGNFSCHLRSTKCCQSLTEVRMPADLLLAGIGCSPSLTKVMACLEYQDHFTHPTPALMASAMVFRTLSCLHRYHPSPSAFVQQLRMCSRVPRLEHSGHAGDSTLPHMYRFDGLGSTLYTAWMRNQMWCGLASHSSAQVTFLLTTFSHLVQAPCCLISTALQVLVCSTAALASS